MAELVDLLSNRIPGTYINEASWGANPVSFDTHNMLYVLGFSNRSGAPIGTPYFVRSLADFQNTFGASASTAAVASYFKQNPGQGFYFFAVPAMKPTTIAVTGTLPAAPATFTLTVGSFPISVTTTATDTATTLLAKLRGEVNTRLIGVARMTDAVVRTETATTVTVSANLTATPGTVPAYPVAQDVVDFAYNRISADMPLGILTAPEYYQAFTGAQWSILANGLETVCSLPRFSWLHYADCSNPVATASSVGSFINQALAESSTLISPQGHAGYFTPYGKNEDGVLVPLSLAVIGAGFKRWFREGFRQPMAGRKCLLRGFIGTSIAIDDLVQSPLHLANINVVRFYSNGRGMYANGARSKATDLRYRFLSTRVILNVAHKAVKASLEDYVHSSVDGQAQLLTNIQNSVTLVLERLRLAGALFGGSPSEAYIVRTDFVSVNPLEDIERGTVAVEFGIKTSKDAEVIIAKMYVTPLGVAFPELSDTQAGEDKPNSETKERGSNQ